MDSTAFGKAALAKFGAVPEGFHIFCAGWIGKRPEDWKSMRVQGAQFDGDKLLRGTKLSTVVSLKEMEQFR